MLPLEKNIDPLKIFFFFPALYTSKERELRVLDKIG